MLEPEPHLVDRGGDQNCDEGQQPSEGEPADQRRVVEADDVARWLDGPGAEVDDGQEDRSAAGKEDPGSGTNDPGPRESQPGEDQRVDDQAEGEGFTSPVSGQPTWLPRMMWSRWWPRARTRAMRMSA